MGIIRKISVVGTACAAEMRLREAVEACVGAMITRTGIPAMYAGVGARLYHAVGYDGAGKSVAVATCADKGVDRCGVISCLGWALA